ncbi:Major facilitator superfamily associated domain [Ceraceosorus bombacis]|uniref:Major facilitator superfamily associated domain n=1 Tax=Ceraceosorus bombacis TaxID=401625 RepID=A0A0P1BM58_9BASI|nr:Major facilitator superfamily associated domain [Ceraceosorus bombacis]
MSTVERWLNSWWKRWVVLAVAPSLVVWFWCAMPFPKTDPYDPNPPWCDPESSRLEAPWCGDGDGNGASPNRVDANFWFFLLFYYGIYCAVALIYITQLFSLYRLNWWPRALGARTSYFTFWLLSLGAGYTLHTFSLDAHAGWLPPWLGGGAGGGTGHDKAPDRPTTDDDIQWQRKTLWVGLAFATMAMPALVCLAGLRRSGRQTYRHSLTEAQKTFLERQLARRIPASYTRFLWFMTTIGLALVALLAGQGYASIYLSSLPHTGFEGTAYVMFWTVNVNVLMLISIWILEEKVRSRALLFCFKYYYFLVYFIFYRNLFARLRSFDQFALIQLLSSFWVCIWYPFSMTSLCHRITQYFNPNPRSWEEYVESVGLAFYLRNLAQNTTMLAFLGWVSILHFGSNQHLYPFFAFDDKRDPYNYQLTMLGSLAIWASELVSSFLARWLCLYCFSVDITNLGLDEMRQHPELVTSVVWTSVHVLQDCLLFLIRLNFR